MDYKKLQFWKKKKIENVVRFQSGGQNNRFLFRVISIEAKIWKKKTLS